MHEISPQAVVLLKAQGVTDAELDELRRTGKLERRSADGTSTMSIDASDMAQVAIPPEVIARMRQFHRFIPKAHRDRIEEATGVDLDGDGMIGSSGRTATAAEPEPGGSAPAHEHVSTTTHGYVPGVATSGNVDGPFVGKRRGGSVLPILLLLVAIGAAVYFVLR